MTRLDLSLLERLRQDYRAAPEAFHATRYWEHYEASIAREIAELDIESIDSGLYPVLATFGFGTVPYRRRSRTPTGRRLFGDQMLRALAAAKARSLPYRAQLQDIHELALARAELAALKAGAQPPPQAPAFGNPQDLFEIDGRRHSVSYLDYFMRYCFVHEVIGLRGDEVFVEIGSGSGKQAALLKQLLPGATFLCFDLPLQLFLAHQYAANALPNGVADLERTRRWTDLSALRKGHIHFFGNWQVPLVRELRFDIFWNAASFGEMEPRVVKHYLSYVTGNAAWVYLMQARHGKQTGRKHGGVEQPQTFEDYCGYLPDYALRRERDALGVLKPYRETGGYFEAVWGRAGSTV